MFENLKRWLRGEFKCRRCGKTVRLHCFGFGEAICPDCYKADKVFIFLDKSYWLNRMLSRLSSL